MDWVCRCGGNEKLTFTKIHLCENVKLQRENMKMGCVFEMNDFIH